MNDQDDGPLWERAQENDGEAFAVLFDRHRARVYRRAMSLTDGAAAAFYELWRKRKTVDVVSGSVLPWLLVTTVNLSRNHRRAATRYRSLLQRLPRSDELIHARDDEQMELRARLTTSLAGLSPADAALVVLTSLEDMPVWQAAQALGVKPATARVRLHRIRRRLRDDLHDLDPTPRTSPEGIYS